MLRFGMFKTQKPRQFDLKPRYYDERKERMDKLINKDKTNGTEEFDKRQYREHLHDNWSRRAPARSGGQLWRMMLIALLLILIVYYLFDLDFIKALNGK